jgi:hypothetical protein
MQRYLQMNQAFRCDKYTYNLYKYVWKLIQTVLELDLWVDKFLLFPQRDLNSHHIYIYVYL